MYRYAVQVDGHGAQAIYSGEDEVATRLQAQEHVQRLRKAGTWAYVVLL